VSTRHTLRRPAQARLLPGGTPTTRRPRTAAGHVRPAACPMCDRACRPNCAGPHWPAPRRPLPNEPNCRRMVRWSLARCGPALPDGPRPEGARRPHERAGVQTDPCRRSRRPAKRTQSAPHAEPSRARPPGRPWDLHWTTTRCETNPTGAACGAIPSEAVRPTEGSLPDDQREPLSPGPRCETNPIGAAAAPSRARPSGRPRDLYWTTTETPQLREPPLQNEPNRRPVLSDNETQRHPGPRTRRRHATLPAGSAAPSSAATRRTGPGPGPAAAAPPLPIPAAS
jgi:hypothetical protein